MFLLERKQANIRVSQVNHLLRRDREASLHYLHVKVLSLKLEGKRISRGVKCMIRKHRTKISSNITV